MMTYEEVVSTIEGKRRFSDLPGVEISRIMSAAVGNPEKSLRFVHIAGTNGKGSTAAFLCEILNKSGIKAGMFTSPHLISYTERIRIGHECISEADVTRIGNRLLSLDLGDVKPSMFDYCFIMALLWFSENDVDIVILETGLGGKLDSTNIIDAPLVSVITHIGFDHMAILGDTLSAIAHEKSGILKKGTFLVTEEQEKEALDVITGEAKAKDISYEIASETDKELGLFGEYQKRNAGCAIACALKLKEFGFDITEPAIDEGLKNTFWPGRMQTIRRNPLVIIDGAHNTDGVNALAETIEKKFGGRKFSFLMGVMADKDYKNMLEIIKPYVSRLTAITVGYSRAESADNISKLCTTLGIDAKSADEPLDKVLEDITEDTIAFGSLYFIGEILNIVQQ